MNTLEQNVNGENNTTIGRDSTINNIFISTPIEEIAKQFAAVNSQIAFRLGSVISSNSEEVDFDCEKLCTSLIGIGIPAKISLHISLNIGQFVFEAIDREPARFSTGHVRRAVTDAILYLPNIELGRNDRQMLAAKYARNYGNPRHINMIIFQDGRTQPISYKYLSESFLPMLAERIIGIGCDLSKFISSGNISYMTKEILECTRRLGIYHIRFETIVALSEDLATQLPHPWLVSDRNINNILNHDRNRILHHSGILMSEECNESEFWRSSYECFNHICSSILAKYGCPIGGGMHAPSNTLRNVTRLAAGGEHQNIALWEFCSIRDIEDDLASYGSSIERFHQILKGLQECINRQRFDRRVFVKKSLTELLDVYTRIVGDPSDM